jgi:hypothetical protein
MPRHIALRGGLELQRPAVAVEPGRLVDCLNYETGIEDGYAPCAGFERYDGRMSPSNRDIWDFAVDSLSILPLYGQQSKADGLTGERRGVAWSPSGLHLFVLIDEGAAGKVYQWESTRAFDLDYALASATGNSFDCTAQTADPVAFAFSTAGDKLYIASATTVYQYSLGIAFNVTTATYDSVSKDLSASETAIVDIEFSTDGTVLLFVGTANDTVYQWALSAAWDISTAADASKSIAIPAAETAVTALALFESGRRLAVIGETLDEVQLYWLSAADDVATATIDALPLIDVGSEDATPRGLHFDPDGTRFWVLGQAGAAIFAYYRSFVPNEELTWVRGNHSGDLGVVADVTFTQDQTTVRFGYWNIDDEAERFATITGATSGVSFTDDFPGSVFAEKSADLSAQDPNPAYFFIKPDGAKVYMIGGGYTIYQYTLSVAWDIDTFAYDSKSKLVSDQEATPTVFTMSSDGTKLYVVGGTDDVAYQYSLSVAWDISTASYAFKSLTLRNIGAVARDLHFKQDGTELYVVTRGFITQYTLSTAWDLDTASYTTQFNGPAENTYLDQILNIDFDADGLTMYGMGSSNYHEEIVAWPLATAWDISSAKPIELGVLDVGNEGETVPLVLQMTSDYIYVLGTFIRTIHQYRRNPATVWTALVDVATDASDYFDQLAAVAAVYRSAITPVPGSGHTLAQKWYRGALYAIRSLYRFEFMDGYGPLRPEHGQHIVLWDGQGNNVYGDEGIVHETEVRLDAFNQGRAEGVMTVEPLNNSFAIDVPLAPVAAGRRTNYVLALSELRFSSGSTEPAQGETLTGATSTETCIVYRVELQSGEWADGDAAGRIFVHTVSGPWTSGENVDRGATPNLLTMDDMIYSPSDSTDPDPIDGTLVNYVRDSDEPEPKAGLYRSSRSGWQKVDMGWEIRFDTGTNEPNAVQFGADTDTQTAVASDWLVADTVRNTYLAWAASAGSVVDAVAASGGAYAYIDSDVGLYNLEQPEYMFAAYGFGFEDVVPDGARIVGVEIEITAKNAAAATEDAALMDVQPYLNDADAEFEYGFFDNIIPQRQALGELTAAFVAYPFGGENDLWNTTISLDTVRNANFGCKFRIEWDAGTIGDNMQVDLVRMRVHYVEQGSLLHFYDTVALADFTTARLVHLHVEDGDWATNDAEGVMWVYDLLKKQIPRANIEIRDAAGGAGNLIGNLIGNERRVALAGKALLEASASKYELIAENVYARDDLEAIYGCSGAAPAFSYDGFYLRQIRSGLSPDLDKPRHLDLFQFRLWLGYGFGEAAISVAGNPLSFDGTLNAVATGFGRPVRGFARLTGKTMGVITDKITYAVTVEGADFDQQIFAPEIGAIEYTILETGISAMYADPRGITTPSATDAYGDFQVGRLSEAAHRWLLPRLQSKGVGIGPPRDRRVVAAQVAQAKSQFRLYFADGYRLTLTLAREAPELTLQRLYIDGDDTRYLRIHSTESELDGDGEDRLFFCVEDHVDYNHDPDTLGYVYAEDAGVSFDGSSYLRFIELAPLPGNDISQSDSYQPFHLYGRAHAYAALGITTSKDLEHPAARADTSEDERSTVRLGAADNAAAAEPDEYFDKFRITRRARTLGIRLEATSDRELPHLLTLLTPVDERSGRPER